MTVYKYEVTAMFAANLAMLGILKQDDSMDAKKEKGDFFVGCIAGKTYLGEDIICEVYVNPYREELGDEVPNFKEPEGWGTGFSVDETGVIAKTREL